MASTSSEKHVELGLGDIAHSPQAAAAKAAEERGKQADAKVVDFESIAPKNAAARKTVRSGAACDLDAQERRREGVERAGRLREELGEGPVTGIEGRLAYRFAKRAFDVAFSAAVLVAFCWLFAIIAVLIKADDPKGPVLFKQRRVGKGGETFQMYKFRSMCVDAEERLAELRELNEKTGPVFKMAEDPRVTRVGRWLRKLSLDELPQFINVLAGDMSVVGPRPMILAEYDQIQARDRYGANDIRPGLTGWAQVNGRDGVTVEEKARLDGVESLFAIPLRERTGHGSLYRLPPACRQSDIDSSGYYRVRIEIRNPLRRKSWQVRSCRVVCPRILQEISTGWCFQMLPFQIKLLWSIRAEIRFPRRRIHPTFVQNWGLRISMPLS
nr:sugar transferase [uncultured Senegalimassilia sp.]